MIRMSASVHWAVLQVCEYGQDNTVRAIKVMALSTAETTLKFNSCNVVHFAVGLPSHSMPSCRFPERQSCAGVHEAATAEFLSLLVI